MITDRWRPARWAPLLLLGLGGQPAFADVSPRIDYEVRIRAGDELARVSLTVHQQQGEILLMDFNPGRQRDPTATGGEFSAEGGRWIFRPGEQGGSIEFVAPLNHQRANGSTDGRVGGDWALFRGDDLVPPARVRLMDDVRPTHRLRMHLPAGWSLASPYGRNSDRWLPVVDRDRLFDRPTGWFLLGEFGLRSERIADTTVWIAGPKNQGVRRMDALAFLRWTMPELRSALRDFRSPLLIVSSGDPFFRGGLAAPNSYFIHSEVPLISEDGTSSFAHELAHLLLPPAVNDDADWITEGLAEFYSIEALRRSGSISAKRAEKTYGDLAERARLITRLDDGPSTGAKTARAVTLFRLLDRALAPECSLDDVASRLAAGKELSRSVLLRAIEQAAGAVPEAFARELALLTR